VSPKRHVPPIDAGDVRLVLLEEADLPMTLAWRNQDTIRRWFLETSVISAQRHRQWFDRYRWRDDDFQFVIHETRTLHRPIGQVGLYRIDWTLRTGEFGRLMIADEAARGRGLAVAASRALIETAFGSFGLTRIALDVRADNHVAIHIYESLGFTVVAAGADGVMAMQLRP
jgi:RimJ/RimL family protein N-acetyltransferase